MTQRTQMQPACHYQYLTSNKYAAEAQEDQWLLVKMKGQ